jgi:hypothetical protein
MRRVDWRSVSLSGCGFQTATPAPLRSTGLAIPPRINGRLAVYGCQPMTLVWGVILHMRLPTLVGCKGDTPPAIIGCAVYGLSPQGCLRLPMSYHRFGSILCPVCAPQSTPSAAPHQAPPAAEPLARPRLHTALKVVMKRAPSARDCAVSCDDQDGRSARSSSHTALVSEPPI